MNNELFLMLLRKFLTIGGTALVTRGVISDSWMDPELISGIALLVTSVVWSNVNRKKLEGVTGVQQPGDN